ncbi:histidinol-phosphate transaminase [Arthrobacter sp. ISL-30]|uniref:histidinol-phosphate transaminase n=1 Tax=Arthrobacter sp. ISL-30 TaxID=2819109 RepID=UPI001BEC1AC3|nr:histidinol-phosphate transaminase [Arthrobacter sp. ISL-30]MBT2513757.1 histidinol-phosphate transaminase [Arthrobacter sp. ISL-30]
MTIAQRAGLEAIAPYKQGIAPRTIHGLEPFKLSSNENPYPPLPSVTKVVAAAAANIHRYPSISADALTNALAERWGVAPGNVALGAGSVEVASQLIHAITNPGDQVMFAWRSFEAYPVLITVAGATPQPVPLTPEGGHDLPAMAAAVTPRTRMIFLCNPNNPTGSVLTASAVEEFIDAVPTEVLIVIDEAYLHFNDDPESAIGMDVFRRHPNVVVLHTFSKAYGLAGLRLGYAIGAPELIVNLRKVAVPFAVTALAQEAGIASLQAEKELQERINVLVAERQRVYVGLLDAGLPVLPSQANFLWLGSGIHTDALASLFEDNALSVRAFPGEGIRISVGTPDSNDRVLATARQAAGLLTPRL